MENRLSFQGMPVTSGLIAASLQDYTNPDAKIERMTKNGELIRLRRDLYMDTASGPVNAFLAANYILTPSYVSGLSALWFYGIIPEYVYDTISMTTKRAVSFNNELGRFSYVSCPKDYFPIGVTKATQNGNTFLIAGKEKALSDLILMTPNLNLRYRKEILNWLEEDMRMDMDILSEMNLDILGQCADTGRKRTMLTQIIKIFK